MSGDCGPRPKLSTSHIFKRYAEASRVLNISKTLMEKDKMMTKK
jgi:hypothetical protein